MPAKQPSCSRQNSSRVIGCLLFAGLFFWVFGPGFVAAQGTSEHKRHPGVEALTEFARIEEKGQTKFILRGKLSKKRAKQMERLARAVQRDVISRFLSDKDKSNLPAVDMCLFETSKSYEKFVRAVYADDDDHSALGFYSPPHRMVVANLGRSVGNLRHEMVHALLGDDYEQIPAWLNEGFGSLYGTAAWTKKGFRFLVNYRLRHLRAARKDGSLPKLEELAASTHKDVYGHKSMAYYGLARYLLLYLDRRGKLDEFVRKMRSKPATAEWQLQVLKEYIDYAAFLKWTTKLKIRPIKAKRK
jgi:hypothetical protein